MRTYSSDLKPAGRSEFLGHSMWLFQLGHSTLTPETLYVSARTECTANA